jgi:hypothetical protein
MCHLTLMIWVLKIKMKEISEEELNKKVSSLADEFSKSVITALKQRNTLTDDQWSMLHDEWEEYFFDKIKASLTDQEDEL